MCIKNLAAKNIYRVIFLIVCEAGLLLQYAAVGENSRMLINYYTILSNIVCFVYIACLVGYGPKMEGPKIKGAITMCITITGLVYHFMLSGNMESHSPSTLMTVSNIIVHYLVPIAMVCDYFLFAPKGRNKWYHIFSWIILPYIYFIYIIIRPYTSDLQFFGFSGEKSNYPYPFLDIDTLGVGKVAIIVACMTVAVLVIGLVFVGVDKLIFMLENRKENNEEKEKQIINNK